MEFIFPVDIPSVAIVDSSARFPVHRIYCVGKNYADHAREMGGDPSREPPCFFSKPADAIVADEGAIPFPSHTGNLHYEVELVVALGQAGEAVDETDAYQLIYGYAVGIDLTRRDLQVEAKDAGRPWDVAKGFDNSAPISKIHPVSRIGHLEAAELSLAVNGEIRQRGNIADMTWSVAEIIAELSSYYSLRPGDLIFTGTPAGVGPVQPGDTLCARVDELDELIIRVGEK
jgi:fumarylpyruvate hydrolase